MKNRVAARMALEALGLEVLTDLEEQAQRGVSEPKIGRGRYRGHKTRWGKLVGDYPIPQGWTYDDVDNNAILVGRMTPETLARLQAEGKIDKHMTVEGMYDLGLVWDEKDQCLYPVYDFADGGGWAMQQVLGQVNRTGTNVSEAYGLLMQAYHAACDFLTAQEMGYELQFYTEGQTTPDGYVVPAGEKVSYAVIPE